MPYERENLERPFSVSMLKGAAMGALGLIIKLPIWFLTLAVWSGDKISKLDYFLMCISTFVASVIVYNSVVGLLTSFDRNSYNEFSEGERARENRFLKIYGYKSVLFEYLGLMFVFMLVGLFGGFEEIPGMFYFAEEGRTPYRMGIFPMIGAIIIGTLVFALDRYEAVRYWRYLRKTGKYDELESKTKIIFRMLFTCLVYPVALPFLPMLASPIMLVAGLIVAVAVALTIPGFILAVVGVFAAVWLFRFWRKRRKRKEFFTDLKDMCAMNDYRLSEIENPYRSLIFGKKKCRFTLEYKHYKFNCLVLSTPKYSVPICFDEPDRGYYRYRLGTKRHNITLRRQFDYSLDGDGIKILIINPTPKHALICDEKKERRLFNADKIWDYVIYEAEAFVNSADRQVLGRFDTDRDNLSEAMVTKKIVHLKRFSDR